MSVSCTLSQDEKFRNPRFLYSYYLAARATADWLSGGDTRAIHYHKTRGYGSFVVETGVDLSFYEPFYNEQGEVQPEPLAMVSNQALYWLAGSAAVYASPYGWAELPFAYDDVWNDMKFACSALTAVCVTDAECKSAAFAFWDGALNLFAHPRVRACVEELAIQIMFREIISDEQGELSAHFEAHLSDLRVEYIGIPVLRWPVRGISEFSNPNWGSVMIASSAKGRAHYARLR